MKTLIIKSIVIIILLASFAACKKEVYPEEIQFLVIDSFTRKPIPNATVNLVKVWQHPVKIGNNATDGDWFPEYGRKHMQELQKGITNKKGKVSFQQEHKKYLYILPGASAEGYQMQRLDTLSKLNKKKAENSVYTIVMCPLVKTTFVFKSRMDGFNTDSIVFFSCDKSKVMRGASIDDKLEVLTSNTIAPFSKVWYTANIYRRGKKQTICNYVASYPSADNIFNINIDI